MGAVAIKGALFFHRMVAVVVAFLTDAGLI
jgi:hypothetical protein